MSLTGGIKAWQARRHAEREQKARAEKWRAVVGTAMKAGAKYTQTVNPDNGAILAVLDEVPDELEPLMETAWFYRLHGESKLYLCQGPPKPQGFRAPDPARAGNRAQRRAIPR